MAANLRTPEDTSSFLSPGTGKQEGCGVFGWAPFKGSEALLDNPLMFGYCYTQLTDVYQETNGIYTFDRKPKYDIDRVRQAQQRTAAIEKEA